MALTPQMVMSRDSGFSPQFIIVDYEVIRMNESVSADGRVYAKLGNAEVGTSFINEGARVGDTRLASVDTRIKLVKAQLRAEVARNESDNPAMRTG
jgi:hypothetical protein